jgi:UDP-N-acetylmuramyl pentapeptide phosphotransferase/UDP-N-acetylglucosamine-1-phosphate transferase
MQSAAFSIASSAFSSFILASALVLTAKQHGRFTMDAPGAVQKFHSRPTPRVGGVGIYAALVVAAVLISDADAHHILATILFAGVPALAIGLLEDVTKQVGIGTRLLATVASGLIACGLSGVWLRSVHIPLLDSGLALWPIAIMFTAFAISGVANSINIIDGFNGLASGTALLAMLALAVIATRVGDSALALSSLVLVAAVAGFWLVNFPWGKLFLGDGGAYFAGFALAWLAVLLPARNPSVSPWASLVVCVYPVTEVLYSVVRRVRRGRPAGQPDFRHLHSLVAARIVPRLRGLDPALQNSAVSVLMWMCAALPGFAAVLLHDHTGWLIAATFGFLLLYHCLYRRVASA